MFFLSCKATLSMNTHQLYHFQNTLWVFVLHAVIGHHFIYGFYLPPTPHVNNIWENILGSATIPSPLDLPEEYVYRRHFPIAEYIPHRTIYPPINHFNNEEVDIPEHFPVDFQIPQIPFRNIPPYFFPKQFLPRPTYMNFPRYIPEAPLPETPVTLQMQTFFSLPPEAYQLIAKRRRISFPLTYPIYYPSASPHPSESLHHAIEGTPLHETTPMLAHEAENIEPHEVTRKQVTVRDGMNIEEVPYSHEVSTTTTEQTVSFWDLPQNRIQPAKYSHVENSALY